MIFPRNDVPEPGPLLLNPAELEARSNAIAARQMSLSAIAPSAATLTMDITTLPLTSPTSTTSVGLGLSLTLGVPGNAPSSTANTEPPPGTGSSSSTIGNNLTTGTHTSTSVVTSSGTTATTSQSTNQGQVGDDAGGNNAGLSSGAQAGIGVGVALVVLLLGTGLFLFWRRNRRKGASSSQESTDPGVPELGGQPRAEIDAVDAERKPELDGDPRSEIDGAEVKLKLKVDDATPHTQVSELDSIQVPEQRAAELPAYAYQYVDDGLGFGQGYAPMEEPRKEVQQHHTPDDLQDGEQTPAAETTQTRQEYEREVHTQEASPSATEVPSPSPGDAQDPGEIELNQLMAEHAQLERQRQRLLQLEQIEQQQAALRDKITAAQQGRQNSSERT